MYRLRTTSLLLLCLIACCAHASTNTWTGGVDSNWFNANNWSEIQVPGAGADASLTNGKTILLTNETALLGSFTINTGTLILSNWYTRLTATNVVINGGTVTLPAAFTNGVMSNRVWIVCSNDFTMNAGAIDVDEKGYAAKNGLGKGVSNGRGGGGGYGGRGGDVSSGSLFWGPPYGSTNAPLDPGSGGGTASGRADGGPGGGAVRIDAGGNVTIDGTISAKGATPGHSYSGAGSGGGIFITCSGSFGGTTNGLLRVDGGDNSTSYGGGGGGGRIAVIYGSLAPQHKVRFYAVPGTGYRGSMDKTNHWQYGARNGVVYLPDTGLLSKTLTDELFTEVDLVVSGLTAWAVDSLALSNCSLTFIEPGFELTVSNDLRIADDSTLGIGVYSTSSSVVIRCGGDLILTNGGALRVFSGVTNGVGPDYGALVSVTGNMVIGANSWVYPYSHETNGGSVLFRMNDLTIAENGGFLATARGYRYQYGPGKGNSGGRGGGGGYGGRGGDGDGGNLGGEPCGSTNAPVEPGSGGGKASGRLSFAHGGGSVRIEAAGDVSINGTIAANGEPPRHFYSGAGAGGSIFIRCAGSFEGAGNGLLQADGGDSGGTAGGGGGGGRIAVWYEMPQGIQARVLADQDVGSGEVIATVEHSDFLGTISVTNGPGYKDPPDPAGAYPGTVMFLAWESPGGTVFIVR